MADHRRVQIGEVWMAYQVSGDPGAPPLVLLHALGEDATNWDGVVAAFVRHWRGGGVGRRGPGGGAPPRGRPFVPSGGGGAWFPVAPGVCPGGAGGAPLGRGGAGPPRR